MIDKGLAKSPTTKIYLATPWFNDVQKERAKKAREYLNQNETVGVIHGLLPRSKTTALPLQQATSAFSCTISTTLTTAAHMSLLCSAASKSHAWSFRSRNEIRKTSKSIS